MAIRDVSVFILHPEAGPRAGPLEAAVSAARAVPAHRVGFLAAGAYHADRGGADDTPFGRRLRALATDAGQGGLVVLGWSAIPLATAADRRALVITAAAAEP